MLCRPRRRNQICAGPTLPTFASPDLHRLVAPNEKKVHRDNVRVWAGSYSEPSKSPSGREQIRIHAKMMSDGVKPTITPSKNV
jgi:hypothetical protein